MSSVDTRGRRSVELVLRASAVEAGVFIGVRLVAAASVPLVATAGGHDQLAAVREALRSLAGRLSAEFVHRPSEANRAALRVLVSERWLRTEVLPWSDEPGATAYAPWAEAGVGIDPPDVRVVGGPLAPARRQAVVFPGPLLGALREVAVALSGDIVSIHPLLVTADGLASGRDLGGVALVDGAMWGWSPRIGAHLVGIEIRGCREPVHDLARHLTRTAWRTPGDHQPKPTALIQLDTPGPPTPGFLPVLVPPPSGDVVCPPGVALARSVAHRPPEFDATGAARPSGRAWGASTVLLMCSMLLLWQAATAAAAWQARTRLQAAAQRAADAAVLAVPPPSDTPAKRTAQRATAIAIEELATSPTIVLGELRVPRDIPADILAVDWDRAPPGEAGGPLHLAVLAESTHDMYLFATWLASRPHIALAEVRRHELQDTPAGRRVRFDVEATWRP